MAPGIETRRENAVVAYVFIYGFVAPDASLDASVLILTAASSPLLLR